MELYKLFSCNAESWRRKVTSERVNGRKEKKRKKRCPSVNASFVFQAEKLKVRGQRNGDGESQANLSRLLTEHPQHVQSLLSLVLYPLPTPPSHPPSPPTPFLSSLAHLCLRRVGISRNIRIQLVCRCCLLVYFLIDPCSFIISDHHRHYRCCCYPQGCFL